MNHVEQAQTHADRVRSIMASGKSYRVCDLMRLANLSRVEVHAALAELLRARVVANMGGRVRYFLR